VQDEEILGLPNPMTWWVGFFIALPACAFWMLRKRDDTAALLVVLFAPLVLPWFATSRPLFMFYMTPAVPFLALMIVHTMYRWRWGSTGLAFVVVAIGLFAYFYPVLAAYPLPPQGAFGWESRIWFGHGIPGDCTSAGIKLLCWI
jgi:dolichyl-phosphate-mannose--protein O-mannosyl transferase